MMTKHTPSLCPDFREKLVCANFECRDPRFTSQITIALSLLRPKCAAMHVSGDMEESLTIQRCSTALLRHRRGLSSRDHFELR